MKPYISHCPCHRPVGETDGAVLRIGEWEIRRAVVLWCACGGSTFWRPTRAREDMVAVPSFRRYTERVEA